MKPSFAVVILWVVAFAYVALIYLNSFFQGNFIMTKNLTLSGQIDDPERQLIILIVVTLIGYTVANLYFENRLDNVSELVSTFLVLSVVLLFASMLVRITWWNAAHFLFAMLTFTSLVGLIISMVPYTEPLWLSSLIAILASISFLPGIHLRIQQGYNQATDSALAMGEFILIVCTSVQLYLFFRSNSR